MRTLIKKSNYLNSISMSDDEVQDMQDSTYDYLQLTYQSTIITVPIDCVKTPSRIPLKDKDGDFKGWSIYQVAKVKLPPGQYGTVKVFSEEEIKKMIS